MKAASMKVWLDGHIVEADAARIDPRDRGFTLGDGLYETIRVVAGKPLRLASHLTRLHSGGAALGLPLPRCDRDVAEAMTDLLRANGLMEGIIRLTLTRGQAPRGIASPKVPHPTLLMAAFPPAPEPPPAQVIVAATTRRNEHSPTARFKTLSALDNIVARREAEERGADDALLLNSAGRLADSTIANVFLVIDQEVVTPPVSEGALPGVMRADVIERLSATPTPLSPADIASASEAFLTNANGIRALIAVADSCGVWQPVGDGHPGPVTLHLKAAVL